MLNNKKEIVPLPFPVYFWQIFAIAVAGLLDALYLAKIHYLNYTDMDYKSFCALSRAINCDTVSQSPYSVFLGLPVAMWGIVGYLVFIILLLFALHKSSEKQRIWGVLFFISFVFLCFSISLALISIFKIHSYCIMCMISYGVNFMLIYYVWLIRRRFCKEGLLAGIQRDVEYILNRKMVFAVLSVLFILSLSSLYIFMPSYWHLKMPSITADVSRGITEDGHPWIGAKDPVLVINEFTDYKCFQCKKMHYFLRHLIAEHPDKIRLVHYHFPMDHQFNPILTKPYHVGTGKLALMALYATANKRFWEVNDILFASDEIKVHEIAEKTGLNFRGLLGSMESKIAKAILMQDIKKGFEHGLTGTPGYLIDGVMYEGQIPYEKLNKIMQQK